jgi:hypothetical protein
VVIQYRQEPDPRRSGISDRANRPGGPHQYQNSLLKKKKTADICCRFLLKNETAVTYSFSVKAKLKSV